jgi:hypothetical protein
MKLVCVQTVSIQDKWKLLDADMEDKEWDHQLMAGIDRNPKLWRNSMTIVDKIQHTPYTNSDPGWQAQMVQMHSTALLEETCHILWKLIQRRTIAEPFLGHDALAKIDTRHSLSVITFSDIVMASLSHIMSQSHNSNYCNPSMLDRRIERSVQTNRSTLKQIMMDG